MLRMSQTTLVGKPCDRIAMAAIDVEENRPRAPPPESERAHRSCLDRLLRASVEEQPLPTEQKLALGILAAICGTVRGYVFYVVSGPAKLLEFLVQHGLDLLKVAGGLLALLGLGSLSPRFSHGARHSTLASLQISASKLKTLLLDVVLASVPLYADIASDIKVLQVFHERGEYGFFSGNLACVIAGLVTASAYVYDAFARNSFVVRAALTVLAFFQVLPVGALLLGLVLFACAPESEAGKLYDSYGDTIREFNIVLILTLAGQAEAFGEALTSTGIQLYSIIHGEAALAIITSVAISLFTLTKIFATLDKRGHVSRFLIGQPMVVGIAPAVSVPFVLIVLYRFSAIIGRLLLFTLFQQEVDDAFQVYGLSFGGIMFWAGDLMVQSFLVWIHTGSFAKLCCAFPNTITMMEPLLFEMPVLSVKVWQCAAVHAFEAALAVIGVLLWKGSGAALLSQVHEPENSVISICVFAFLASQCVQWPLFAIIRCCCVARAAPGTLVIEVATSECQRSADKLDKSVPLSIVANASFFQADCLALDGLLEVLQQYQTHARILIGAVKALRTALSDDASKLKDESMPRILDAVRLAMEMHRSDAKLQTEACIALSWMFQDETNRKLPGAALAIDAVRLAMEAHRSDATLQTEAFEALNWMFRDETNRKL